MNEFTGERVIPGQVEDDLWAEHLARYAFAARFASGKRVLDIGCGTGYGTDELSKVAQAATGIDVSVDAIAYAAEHYSGLGRNTQFQVHTATALPFPDASFDLVAAFEIIEHLEQWQLMLEEARRVLSPGGLFLVSTPNKSYYAEARAASGPNPFHVHEFEYPEFAAALKSVFPYAQVLLQDRVESFVFYNADSSGADAQLRRAGGKPADANFFIGLASASPLPTRQAFAFVPNAANLLREREQHVRKLELELAQVRLWLDQTTDSRDQILTRHNELQQHLESQNRWGRELEQNLEAARARIAACDRELQQAQAVIERLEQENLRKTEWAQETERRLSGELAHQTRELQRAVNHLNAAEQTVVERTRWAQSLDAQLIRTQMQLDAVRQSRWLTLGQALGLGPQLEPPSDLETNLEAPEEAPAAETPGGKLSAHGDTGSGQKPE